MNENKSYIKNMDELWKIKEQISLEIVHLNKNQLFEYINKNTSSLKKSLFKNVTSKST